LITALSLLISLVCASQRHLDKGAIGSLAWLERGAPVAEASLHSIAFDKGSVAIIIIVVAAIMTIMRMACA